MSFIGPRSLQFIATFATSILTCTVGLNLAWSSPALPLLVSDESPIGVKLTVDEGSWVSSIFLLGYVIGIVLTGALLDLVGRRNLLLMSAVPIFICWIMIYFARSFIVLCVARFVGGIGLLVPTVVSVVYVSEISEPLMRGKLSMFNYFMLDVGTALMNAIGCYLSFHTVAAISAAFPVVFILLFYWMPESPYQSILKGQMDTGRDILRKFRNEEDVERELMELKVQLEHEKNNEGTFRDLFMKRKFRKALLLILGMVTLQQFSGSISITNYMKTIFLETSSGLDANLSNVLCNVVTVPTTLIGSYFIDRSGRKPLYYVSLIMCTIGLCCNYVYFLCQDTLDKDVSSLGWLPITGLFIYCTFISVGIGYMPFIFFGEIFDFRVKSQGLFVTCVYNSLAAFIVTFTFPLIADEWNISICFLIYIISCVIGFLFVLIYVPETKGKTLEEVQDML